MNEGGADETFVRGEKLELAVHEGEELFFQGCLSQAGIVANGSNSLVHLLLEEMECDIFLGLEIVEDRAFGDRSLARNCLGRGGVKAFGLKERQRGCHNSLPNRGLVLRAPPRGTRCCRAASPLRFRWRSLLGGHKNN